MNKKTKILSVIFFITLLGMITFLFFSLNKQQKLRVKIIDVTGNIHLSTKQYIKFARLNDKSEYSELNLAIIKDRLEKHPYIKNADVKYNGENKITIHLYEKKFDAVLLGKNGQMIITDNLQIIPLFPFTKNINLPVINYAAKNFKGIKFITKNDSLIFKSLKIILAAKLISPDFYSDISDIDLNNNHNIVLRLNYSNYYVDFGGKELIEKLFYFNKVWENLKSKNLGRLVKYVDLRFNKLICLGLKGQKPFQEKIKI